MSKNIFVNLFCVFLLTLSQFSGCNDPIALQNHEKLLCKDCGTRTIFFYCRPNFKCSEKSEMQLSFFQLDDPLLENIREEILATNIDTLTPIEALMKLNEIKRMLIKK